MRALLLLLVACGGSSPTPDAAAPAIPHYALDFTFGTNGEALVTPTSAPDRAGLALVATPAGLAIATTGAASNSVCLANQHGKVDAAFGTGGCAALPGEVGRGRVVADATFLATIDQAGATLTHVDATGASGPPLLLPFAPSALYVESATKLFVTDGRSAVYIDVPPAGTAGSVTTSEVKPLASSINEIAPGPTFVGADANDRAIAIRTDDTLAKDAGYAASLDAPGIRQAYADGDGLIALANTSLFRLDATGDLDAAFGSRDVDFANGAAVLANHLVAVVGPQLQLFDRAGNRSTDLDPLPAANAPASLEAIVATDDGGFIAAGFTSNGQSVALVHYVPL